VVLVAHCAISIANWRLRGFHIVDIDMHHTRL
jgi:hypothetical protein